MIPAYLLLLLPLLGIIYFALFGHKEDVGQQNTRFNGVTLLLSLWLAVNVFNSGTILSADEYFIVDSFNVYLIVLTAFVGFTTSIFRLLIWRMKRDR